jgi:hypothetical protein
VLQPDNGAERVVSTFAGLLTGTARVAIPNQRRLEIDRASLFAAAVIFDVGCSASDREFVCDAAYIHLEIEALYRGRGKCQVKPPGMAPRRTVSSGKSGWMSPCTPED